MIHVKKLSIQPTVCAYCKQAFTDERPFDTQRQITVDRLVSLKVGQSREDGLAALKAREVHGIYVSGPFVYDEDEEASRRLFVSFSRYHHVECHPLALERQADEELLRARLSTKSLLRSVGFDDADVQIVASSEQPATQARHSSRSRCLQVSSSLANFTVCFPTAHGQPYVDLASIESCSATVTLGDILAEVRCLVAPPEDWPHQRLMVQPESDKMVLRGGLAEAHAVARDQYNLLCLMALRTLVSGRETVCAASEATDTVEVLRVIREALEKSGFASATVTQEAVPGYIVSLCLPNGTGESAVSIAYARERVQAEMLYFRITSSLGDFGMFAEIKESTSSTIHALMVDFAGTGLTHADLQAMAPPGSYGKNATDGCHEEITYVRLMMDGRSFLPLTILYRFFLGRQQAKT